MKKVISVLAAAAVILVSCSRREPISGVIITGQNNHNWPVSNVALKKILDNSGLFRMDVAISPAAGEDMSGFGVDFSRYQVVVLDYNGAPWPQEMNEAFLRYVAGGGGVVVYHAANNSFPDWEEYNKIIALGGWEGRNEYSGPYIYWKDGGLLRDDSPGPGGSHGVRHEFVLNRRNSSHPIVKGLPERWKHASDELYDRMRGPGEIGDLLYTAYSSPDKAGSGREEPLIFTVPYGKGRIFHIMLGHCGESLEDNPAMQCAGFQTLLLRGAEWCATGRVSQKAPSDFPTESEVSLRPDYKATGCGSRSGKKAGHVIFIGVDGVSTPAFKDPAMLSRMPNLRMMMEQGSFTLAKRSVMPSSSAINWASIFMGLPTEQHGYGQWNSSAPEIPAVLDNGRGMPPTIFTLLREQRPKAQSGCVYNWDGIGPLVDTAVIDYHLYDPGYHNPENYSLEGYTTERAVKYILDKKPDFFTFYIGDVDEVGHREGWETPAYYDCLAETDRMVGLVIQAAKDAGIFDDTIFVFSSDHGGSGRGHGQLTMAHLETPFILYGKNIRKGFELEEPMMQYDLTATLAYALGLKTPPQWRGRVMEAMFK